MSCTNVNDEKSRYDPYRIKLTCAWFTIEFVKGVKISVVGSA